jgi:hypothetical protein
MIYHYVRDIVQRSILSIQYVPMEKQTTYILTKPLSWTKYVLSIKDWCFLECRGSVEISAIARALLLKLSHSFILCLHISCFNFSMLPFSPLISPSFRLTCDIAWTSPSVFGPTSIAGGTTTTLFINSVFSCDQIHLFLF